MNKNEKKIDEFIEEMNYLLKKHDLDTIVIMVESSREGLEPVQTIYMQGIQDGFVNLIMQCLRFDVRLREVIDTLIIRAVAPEKKVD